jgi:hypothetical protein
MTDTSDELRRQAAALTAQADQLDASQLTSVAGMTPEAINTAREAGRLQVLLGADPDEVALTQRAQHGRIDIDTVHQLADLGRHDLIEQARESGRIDYPNTTGA